MIWLELIQGATSPIKGTTLILFSCW